MAKVSKTGYKRNSTDKNEPALVIPSNEITMKDVDFPVFGTDNMGYSQMMYPGMNYTFPGDFVYEIPMAQSGGDISIPDLSDKGWLSKYQDGGVKTFGSRLEYIDEPDGMRIREKGTDEWKELDSNKSQVLKNLMEKFAPKANEPQDYVDKWLSSLGVSETNKPATPKPPAPKPVTKNPAEEPANLVESPVIAEIAPETYSLISGVDIPKTKEIKKTREVNKYATSPEFFIAPYKDEDEAVNAYKQTADFNLRYKNASDYTPDDIVKVQSYLDEKGYYPETKKIIKVEDYQTPEQVIELQKYLANEGLLEVLGVTGENIDGNLSGKIDKKTLDAIRQYNMYNQKYNSGQLDNNTKDAIRAYKNKIDAKSTLGIPVRSPFELYDPQTGEPNVGLTNQSMQDFEKDLMKRGFFTGNVKYDFNLKPSDIKIGYNFSINPNHDYDNTEDAKVKGQVVRGCAQYINGTVCSEDVVGEEAREELGFKGDAWTLSENLQSKGGKLLFTGLPERSQIPLSPKAGENEIKNYLKSTLNNDAVKGQLREMLNTGNIKPGDVVNIFYEGSPSTKKAWNQTQPLNNRFFTTHVGIVKADKDGKLYVEHNVHGDLQKQPVEDFIEGKVPGNSKSQVSLIAGITRPNYFDGVDNDGRIPAGGISYYQTEYGQFRPEGALANQADWAGQSISGESTHKFLSVIEKNKDSILKDIPITENEFGKLMRVARIIPTRETYAGKNYEKSVISNVLPGPSGVVAGAVAKGLQDTLMPEREKSMGISSLKDETNINPQLRSKLYKSDYELTDPVKAGVPTFYVLSKNYLYLKEVANEYGLDITSDQLAKLAGIAYNQSIGKVAAQLIEQGGYDNYINYRRANASKGDGKFQYHEVVDLYDKQTMKHGGWLKKYQGDTGSSQVTSELAKFMKQPVDPNDLRYVGNQQAVSDNTRATIKTIPGVTNKRNLEAEAEYAKQKEADQAKALFRQYDLMRSTPEGSIAKKIPGALGSMITVYENSKTGETIIPESEQRAQQAIMDRKDDADQFFNNMIFPTGAGAFYGASNIAQGNVLEGGLELAGTLPIPFLKSAKGTNSKQLPGSSSAPNAANPGTLSELTGTGFQTDPYYHFNTFRRKRDEIANHLRSPEGRDRLQNYIDNNPHLQQLNKSVDDIIDDFTNTRFVTQKPHFDTSTGDWVRDADGNIEFFPVDPNNAFNWYLHGYNQPSFVSMGQNFTPYDAEHILEHEFAHTFQRGKEIAGVDDVLANMSLKQNPWDRSFLEQLYNYNPFGKTKDSGYSISNKKYGNDYINWSKQKDYWLTGAGRGQEKAAFAAEIRENLLQRGLLKNRYDEITPELLEKHYKMYNNTTGDKYRLRLYDIMKKDKTNFKLLSDVLNKMPAVVPAAIGTGAAGAAIAGSQTPQQKYGGWINKYQKGGNPSKNQYINNVTLSNTSSWLNKYK